MGWLLDFKRTVVSLSKSVHLCESLANLRRFCCGAGVKVGDELITVKSMMVSELDMIYIESILKASSSVDVTLRSVRAATTNQQPLRSPNEQSLASSQNNQVVEVAVASSAEMASHSGSAGRKEIASKCQHLSHY